MESESAAVEKISKVPVPMPGLTKGKQKRQSRRRRAQTLDGNTRVRYFLAKENGHQTRPELGEEFTEETAAMIKSFQTGLPFFTLTEWRAATAVVAGVPQIIKAPFSGEERSKESIKI